MPACTEDFTIVVSEVVGVDEDVVDIGEVIATSVVWLAGDIEGTGVVAMGDDDASPKGPSTRAVEAVEEEVEVVEVKNGVTWISRCRRWSGNPLSALLL